MRRPLICLSLVAPLLTACGPGEPVADDEPASPPPESASMDRSPELEAAVRAARRELTTRMKLSNEAVGVESAEMVEWSSGALGCPEPGTMYTQALVPGYRIVLTTGDDRHHYHGARGEPPFLCPAERAEKPARTRAGSSGVR